MAGVFIALSVSSLKPWIKEFGACVHPALVPSTGGVLSGLAIASGGLCVGEHVVVSGKSSKSTRETFRGACFSSSTFKVSALGFLRLGLPNLFAFECPTSWQATLLSKACCGTCSTELRSQLWLAEE